VKFVDQSKIINDQEKYFYLKTLRAQLSAHEQLILFYSALSEIGKPWVAPINYIARYRLIKNVPLENGFTYGINPASYFAIGYEEDSTVRARMK
jgi:Putative phage abortive infection protein